MKCSKGLMFFALGIFSLVFFLDTKAWSLAETFLLINSPHLIAEQNSIAFQPICSNSSTVKDNGTPESEATGSQGQS